MIHKARVFLIELGKILPFVVCFFVLVSYVEDVWSLSFSKFVVFDNSIVLNKPVSWWIGQYFEYNLITVVILLTISVAVETCVWNKLAVLYLAIQLVEKEYFSTIELYPEYIYAICIANILICSIFCYKGLRILTSSRKQ